MVFEVWFQSDQREGVSGSVAGKLGEISLSLRLGSAREKGGRLGESKVQFLDGLGAGS